MANRKLCEVNYILESVLVSEKKWHTYVWRLVIKKAVSKFARGVTSKSRDFQRMRQDIKSSTGESNGKIRALLVSSRMKSKRVFTWDGDQG
jgi:hypothetical protein